MFERHTLTCIDTWFTCIKSTEEIAVIYNTSQLACLTVTAALTLSTEKTNKSVEGLRHSHTFLSLTTYKDFISYKV